MAGLRGKYAGGAGMSETPIEDYLDELLRRTHADPRTIRRLLDEANDHLFAAASEFEVAGMARVDAEREAVRRLGPATELARGSWRRSFKAMVLEVLRAAILLGGWGLVAVGLSGGVVALMNAVVGRGFVGGGTVLGTGGHTITETAHDAVSLRILAGIVGLLVLAGYALLRRYARPATVLPSGLVDALGAAGFAAATVVLGGAAVDQGTISGNGVGFFLSGALISLAGAIAFCARATRALVLRR
jgi:hypothetical protein